MRFSRSVLRRKRPGSIRKNVALPRRQDYHPSPGDWRDEVLYFLLVDRFSDGLESSRPLLDRKDLEAARSDLPDGEPWQWDRWAESGGDRWQGGTLEGVGSKLRYLKRLGATAIWLSPVLKQREHLDTYHGYGVQDFLDVDPHFGRRQDLVRLVAEAHELDLRVILDVIFNHSGCNWIYPPGTPGGEYRPDYTTGRYPFGHWLGAEGEPVAVVDGREQGVWPSELLNAEAYTRAGCGNLGAGDINDSEAEHKRTDFETLRDFRVSDSRVLGDLALCYKYWIALTDCDGFRIDTLKHVPLEEARNFCGTIKEFASNLGKKDFLIVGEIAGGDYNEDRYLDVLGRNLNAALDIGEMRLSLNALAKGLLPPDVHFRGFDPGKAVMGSHRNLGGRHVAILDDHDHVFGEKVRFSTDASSPHQVVAGVALQLLTLGIPCIYYGTEQALSGPEPGEREWLPGWKGSDRYLREAMFGPQHPRKSGIAGLARRRSSLDQTLPGFGPFGTAGHHCFDEQHPAYLRIAALAEARAAFPALRYGRQYLRPISFLGWEFGVYGPGEIAAWSRILDDEEFLCVLNTHGTEFRGADVLVDAHLSPPGTPMTVVLNTVQSGEPAEFAGSYPFGSTITVRGTADGKAYVEVRDLPPSEVLVLTNHPRAEEGGIRV